MRRQTAFGLALVAGLVATGIAVAVTQSGISPVATTGMTLKVDSVRSATCTGPGGTFQTSRVAFSGTATGEPRLSGKVDGSERAVVNTTSHLGFAEGTMTIRDASTGARKAKLSFSSVNAGNNAKGLIRGKVENPSAQLLANFSAIQNPTTGVVTLSIGGNSLVTTDPAIFVGATCATENGDHQNGNGNGDHQNGNGNGDHNGDGDHQGKHK